MKRVLAALLLLCAFGTRPAAAEVIIRTMRAAAIITTGTQDFIIAGLFNTTPKGAMIVITYAVTDNTPAANGLWSVSGLDCGNIADQWTYSAQDRADAGVTTDTNKRGAQGKVAMVLDKNTADGALVDGEGTASCITDGVRINWTVALSEAYLVHVTLFGGSHLLARADIFEASAVVNGAVDIIDVGFQPEAVICVGATSAFDDVSTAHLRIGIGVSTGTTEGAVSMAANDNGGTTNYGGGTTGLYGCNSSAAADMLDTTKNVGSFDAQGFTVTTRLEALSFVFGYIALSTQGTSRMWVGEVQPPALAQSQAYTAPGWRPQFVMLLLTGGAVLEVGETDDDGALFGIALLDATSQFCISTRGDDGAVSAVDNASLSDDVAINMPNATGATRFAGTLTSFDATGWTINYTTSSPASWWGFAIEESVPQKRRAPLWFQ